MDIDDDDAFLYGDESPPKAEVALPAVSVQQVKSEDPSLAPIPTEVQDAVTPVTNGMSSAMAASLAAYNFEPSISVADNPEDGGVEEEEGEEDDDDDDSDDDSDDDIKVVFTGQNARTLDLRKPQTAPSNVIGIGKWAHTSTGITPAPAPAPATPGTPQPISTPSKPIQPTANQTTEYTPTSRPGASQAPSGPLANPPIASTPSDSLVTLQPGSSGLVNEGGAPPINPNLPQSTLPPVSSTSFITQTNGSTKGKYDPTNPSGIIPSTGQSVFELDMTQFENSGQPWRKPGSTLTDYFNFGFDEFTYPRYLKFKSDMEKGRAALANLPPMAQLPPEIANLLHLQNQQQQMNMPFNPIAQQQQQQQIQQQQQQQQQMQIMANQIQQQMGMMNPQMQAQMQQMMAMQGLDLNMMNQGVPFNNMQNQGMGQPQLQGQGQIQQGMGQQGMMRPGQNIRPNMTPAPQPGTTGTPEAGEESVKQEEGAETGGETPELQQGQMANPVMRGRMPVRGVPVRGVPLRGRGVAVPLGPRAGFAAPTGPKAGRFRDKDKVDTSGAGSLDYGASEGGGDSDVPNTTTTIKSERASSSSRQDQVAEEGEEQIVGESGSRSHSQIGRSRSQSQSRDRSRSASPISRKNNSGRRGSKRDYDSYTSDESDRERERNRNRDRGKERDREREREKDKDKDRKRSTRKSRNSEKDDATSGGAARPKRKREEGGGGGSASVSATLGPGGWESDEEEEERRSRRKRSPSEEETEKRTRRSKRR